MAGNGRVVAFEHRVPDGARRAGPAREHRDEPVARDATPGDLSYDLVHARSPVQ
jgi:hypothetical protein